MCNDLLFLIILNSLFADSLHFPSVFAHEFIQMNRIKIISEAWLGLLTTAAICHQDDVAVFEKHLKTSRFFQSCQSCYKLCVKTIKIYISLDWFTEAVAQRCSVKKVFLEILQNSQESTCAKVSFIEKETLAQGFSCEFCAISKNTFSYRTPLMATSGLRPVFWYKTLSPEPAVCICSPE